MYMKLRIYMYTVRDAVVEKYRVVYYSLQHGRSTGEMLLDRIRVQQ